MSRHVVSMTIDDVEHYSAKEKARIIASYPAHEREARAKGIPTMGSGRIFPVTEESITVPTMAIPDHWPQIIGVDFGIEHPFAAARLAFDPDADCIYVTHCFRQSGSTPPTHATAVKAWGKWIPVAWPHDGLNRDKGSGDQLAEQYRSHDLNMLPEKATHAKGGNGVEAGLTEMLERMETGRLKVFAGLNDWFEEMRLYHRVDGVVVKERDDLLSASRYAVMMKRFAKKKPREMVNLYGNSGGGSWLGA